MIAEANLTEAHGLAMMDPRPTLDFVYKNYRGEVGLRKVTPLRVEFRSSDWHPGPQWLLVAYDHEKGGERDFAMSDIVKFSPNNE